MSTEIVKRQMPEERELEKKRAELKDAEEALAERELELATYQAELHEFEQRYLRIVGSRYAELDEVNAQVAEARARLNPENEAAREQAEQSREQAQESAGAAAEAVTAETRVKFKPSDDLKSLYRELARMMHPDLATDADERARRHQLMIEINRAYEMGDAARLQDIRRKWQHSPAAIKDESVGAELVRVIRQIAQIEERMLAIDAEIERLEASELLELKCKVENAEIDDRDLLAEMAADLEEEIYNAKAKGYDLVVRLLKQALK
ncbi:MAG: molecular chaperone DnaJ [Acidobacteria bacterium]|nr:molecular chaperone DnaJ [Acidobacteriota bacterium]